MTRDNAHRSRWHLVGAAERTLMGRWTHPLPRPADELLVMLSRAADHSVLWGVLATAAVFVIPPTPGEPADRVERGVVLVLVFLR